MRPGHRARRRAGPAAIGRRRTGGGAALVEVIVALLLLGAAGLGVSAAASRAYGPLQSTQQRGTALLLLQDYAERARLNPRGVAGGGYAIALGDTPPAAPSPGPDVADDGLAANAVAVEDRRAFLAAAAARLPMAQAQARTAEQDGVRMLQLWLVWWNPGQGATEGAATASPQCPAELGEPAPEHACLNVRFAL